MPDFTSSPARAYLLAVLLVLLATGARALLSPYIGGALPFITYFPAVFAAAWVLGRGPTVAVVVLGALTANYLFITPGNPFGFGTPIAVLGLTLFAGVGLATAVLGGRVSEARRIAERHAAENQALRQVAEDAAVQAEEAAAEAEEEAARAVELADEQERLAGALDKQRAQLETILQEVPVGIAMRDANGTMMFMNPEGERILGGMDVRRADAPELAGLFLHVDGRPYTDTELPTSRARLHGEVVRDEELVIHRPDGSDVRISASAAPVHDTKGELLAVAAVFVDITARTRAEAALLESQRRLEAALETGRMGTFEWLIPEGLVRWSPSLESMHGYAPGAFAGTADAYFAEIHPDDQERVGHHIEEVLAGRREHRLEYRIVRTDGSVRWVEGRGQVVRDADGRPLRLLGICADVNERKVAEEAVRRGEARYRSLVQASAQVILTADADGAFREPSPTWEAFTGQRPDEYLGTGYAGAIHPDDAARVLASWRNGAGGGPVETRFRLRRADGEYRRVLARTVPIRDGGGTLEQWIGTISDIDDEQQAQDALQFLGDASAALSSSLDYETTLRQVARLAVPTLADWCAVDLAEPDGTLRRIAISHVDPSKEPWAWDLARRFPPRPEDGDGTYAVLRSGEAMIVPTITPEMIAASPGDPEFVQLLQQLGLVSYIGVPLIAHGEVFGVLSLLMSESGRHYSDADLRLAEELGRRAAVAVDNARRHRTAVDSLNMLDAMLAASPIGQAFVDRSLRYLRVSPALAALHDLPPEAHLGRTIGEVLPAWAPALEPLYREVLEREEPVLNRMLTVPAPAGGSYDLLVNCFPVRDASGEVCWIGVTKEDVTERRRAEQALRASEGRLRRVVESPLIGIGFYDADGRIVGANRALRDLLGYTREEIDAGALRWDANLTPPEYAALDAQAGREVEESGVSRTYEKELLRKDGSRVPVLAGGARLDDENRTGVFYVLDLTERRRVEEQVQAAQRLEAVGRLAGGVAHEINNALQGVLGFNAFVLRRLEPEHPVRADAVQVQRAGERAAKITQQLLAYGRRQVLQAADLDLVRLVQDFTPMLRQALGAERELVLALPDREMTVHADRSQLEQVLLNLSLNARDATPPGGRLAIRIERRRVSGAFPRERAAGRSDAGEFVELIVEDTGCGMDAATQARAFEPFFTTKEPGAGTGLGLAVVYGIVQQSGGHIQLESEVGRGTRLRVLLPAVARAAAGEPAPGEPPAGGGTETVLLVDDEPVVRAVAGTVLRDAGYAVIEAVDGREALELVAARAGEGKPPVGLVLTDIVMPNLGGRGLADALLARTPGLPIVFMSGYTGDEAVDRGLMAADAEFLQKPFTSDDLLRRIRTTLDRRTV